MQPLEYETSHSSSSYLVKEIFGPTIQGEGAHSGASCVFLRFAACNLACTWCDTDFSPDGARKLSGEQILHELLETDREKSRMVVITGGEPSLQWDQPLAALLAQEGFRVHMETNGTRALAAPVDWLTISPKPQFHSGNIQLLPVSLLRPSECKVVVDDSVTAQTLSRYEEHYQCEHRFLQPCMGDNYEPSLRKTLTLITQNPTWRLSLQLHKIVGVP